MELTLLICFAIAAYQGAMNPTPTSQETKDVSKVEASK